MILLADLTVDYCLSVALNLDEVGVATTMAVIMIVYIYLLGRYLLPTVAQVVSLVHASL